MSMPGWPDAACPDGADIWGESKGVARNFHRSATVMTQPSNSDLPQGARDRRAAPGPTRTRVGGVVCRPEDAENTQALHSVAILLRVMSGLLLVLAALQLFVGFTASVEISIGVLFGEMIRLVVFAGLLWAAADLADLFIKSHYDLRGIRIMLARLAYRAAQQEGAAETGPPAGDAPRDRGDDVRPLS